MSMLAASVAHKSRKFSSKIPHISACQELAARAFSAGSDDKKDIDTRHNVSYRPPRAGYAWMSEYQSGFATVSSPVSFLDSPQHVRAIANFCSPRLSREGAALFLDEGRLMQSSVLYKGPRMDTMTHQAMRRIVFTSVRALNSMPSSTSTPFQQTIHRIGQRAYFSSQPEPPTKETATSSTGTNVSAPPSASFSTSTTPSSDEKKPSYAERAKLAIESATKSIINFFLKLPGIMWFYLTHPRDLYARMQELKEAAKKEAHHYYMGSKLLVADVKTAWSMLKRTLQGSALSRRERKQLLRTVSDLFRLVPFSMFVLIPFMEFALPIALRLFPNMLPSTFQDSLKAEESMKRELKSRIAMAAFFQETLQDLVKEQQKDAERRKLKNEEADNKDGKMIAEKQEESAADMLNFLEKARNGELLPPEVIIQYANYFQDDLTLDNMPRMQLINMCKYMNIPPYGADAFLRFQLRHKIRTLKEDDQRILWEGIDSLTKMELREACQERGMRSTGLSKDGYKRSLQQWLDLSVNKSVPISLLIMSRIFFLRDEMTIIRADDDGRKSMAGLADAISGLDKDVVNEAVLEVATFEEKKSNPDVMKIKLAVLEQQNERIRQEQEEREAAAKKKEQEKEKEKEKQEALQDESSDKITSESTTFEGEMDDGTKMTTFEEEKAASSGHTKAKEMDEVSEAVSKDELKPVREEREEEEAELSPQEMDAISQLASPDPVNKEREALERIKAAMKAEEEELKDVAEVAADEKTFMDEPMDDRIQQEMEPPKDKSEAPSPTESKSSSYDESTSEAKSETQTLGKAVVEVQERKLEIPIIEKHGLEKSINRLKNKVESMVEKIETQLSDVEIKIGDKLHFLDKDMDGIVSREEMALCLQQVLKRELTFDEALSIAATMDADNDGVLTVAEFISWIDSNKLVTLLEEGRDTDIDSILAKYHQKEDDETSMSEPKEKK